MMEGTMALHRDGDGPFGYDVEEPHALNESDAASAGRALWGQAASRILLGYTCPQCGSRCRRRPYCLAERQRALAAAKATEASRARPVAKQWVDKWAPSATGSGRETLIAAFAAAYRE
jgi:hypothetical protein